MGGSGIVYAAGQPQLSADDMQTQGSAQQRMDTKRMLDAEKYRHRQPQSAANDTEQGPPAAKTGVEPRGTKVAPSTEANQAQQPATGDTGTPPRGTKVAPSTNPGQEGSQTQTR
jgi:hypothetical protein